MTPFEHLKAYIRERRKSGESWEAIAKSFGHSRVTKGHVWKMYNKDWEPDDPELRLLLSLPAFKPMPICPVHGVVHEYDCQTQVVKPLPKPRPPRPARIAIRKDDMQSAANTITNNLSSGQVRLLVVKLLLKLKENER